MQMRCFKPYFVYRPPPSQRAPAGGQSLRLAANRMSVETEEMLLEMHSMYVMFIMCNVAALTFYATIYEDICRICNVEKSMYLVLRALLVVCVCRRRAS